MNVAKSSVARLFGVLSLFLTAVLILFSIGIYSYGREIVGRESIHLHEDSISWLATDLGQMLRQSGDYGRKVAGNYRLLALVGKETATGGSGSKLVAENEAGGGTGNESMVESEAAGGSGSESVAESETAGGPGSKLVTESETAGGPGSKLVTESETARGTGSESVVESEAARGTGSESVTESEAAGGIRSKLVAESEVAGGPGSESVAMGSETASEPDSKASLEKEIHKVVYDLQADFNSSITRGRALMDTYVVTAGGTYSAYNSERFLWNAIAVDSAYRPVIEQGEETVIPTSYDPDGSGIMQYTFQLAFPMKDYATGELRGVVILDISELMLSLQLNSFLQDNVDLSVVDAAGTVLFARRKQEIGTLYPFTMEELEAVNASATVRERMRDGYFHLVKRIPGTDWYLVDTVDESAVFAPLNSLGRVMLLTSAAVLLLLLGAVVLAGRTIFKRTSRIRDSIREVERGNLSVEMSVANNDEFGEIEAAFNRMIREINDLIGQVEQKERAKRVAEMDVLRSQINAHFIHNTLASIRFMMEMNRSEEAGEMVFYFSRLLRQTLDNSAEFVTLGEELETLRSYLTLEHFRYAGQFEEHFEIGNGTEKLNVLPLMLQPIVENAIFHAVGKKFIHIVIAAEVRDGVLMVHVRDNGVGIPEEKAAALLSSERSGRHIGLRNVHERIQLYFGQAYGLEIRSREGVGTEVTYRLPAVTAEGSEGCVEMARCRR